MKSLPAPQNSKSTSLLESKPKWHLLYKTTCVITGKYYVGVHSTNKLNDGYFGSGVRISESIKEFGRRNHTREILQMTSTREELLELEKATITKEMILDPMCLNLGLGGGGPSCMHPESREKISKAHKGRFVSEESKRRRSEGLKGLPKSDEHKASLSVAMKGKPGGLKGKKLTEEHKRKLSESMKRARARK